VTPFDDEPTQPVGTIARPPWVTYARSKIGTHEVAGAQDNPFVVECLKLAGLPTSMQHDETAWCGAFAGRCMRESGISPPKGYAAARNWLKWGTPIGTPVEGCIAVFWRDDPKSPHGHVAMVVGVGPGTMLQMLGGNQNNQVMVKAYPRARLLGLRWPAGVQLPPGVAVVAG
jgi:uncharacterized protein (TIGR02594 family)